MFTELEWETLLHLPFSYDLFFWNIHLLQSLQNKLNDKNLDAVQSVVNYLTNFYEKVTSKLVQRLATVENMYFTNNYFL